MSAWSLMTTSISSPTSILPFSLHTLFLFPTSPSWTLIYALPLITSALPSTTRSQTHSYLHQQSSHPRHCKDGLLRSQLLRLRRLCSDDSDFLEKGREMISFFCQCGYCATSLQRDLDVIQRFNRNDVIKHQDPGSRDLS